MYCYSFSINVWKINLESKKVSVYPVWIIRVREALTHPCVWEGGRSGAFISLIKYGNYTGTLIFQDTIPVEVPL